MRTSIWDWNAQRRKLSLIYLQLRSFYTQWKNQILVERNKNKNFKCKMSQFEWFSIRSGLNVKKKEFQVICNGGKNQVGIYVDFNSHKNNFFRVGLNLTHTLSRRRHYHFDKVFALDRVHSRERGDCVSVQMNFTGAIEWWWWWWRWCVYNCSCWLQK